MNVQMQENGIESMSKELQKIHEQMYLTDRLPVTNNLLKEERENIKQQILAEFNRVKLITKSSLEMRIEENEYQFELNFIDPNSFDAVILIPLPQLTSEGVEVLQNESVTRVLCDYWLEESQERIRYLSIIKILICEDVNKIFPRLTSGSGALLSIVKAFTRGQGKIATNSLQRLINDITFKMPLHETNMNSWVMNSRLMVIDKAFDEIVDPNEKLQYQIDKNKKYYAKFGWTSIGLSDGVLADKNYILTTDLRRFIPFGLYHNPQRNLYSTLAMKGDELPRVRSKSMQKLLDSGITRKGWNLFTVAVDVPLNFEDQIIVNRKLASKFHKVTRKFTIYTNNVRIKKGDKLDYHSILGYSTDGQAVVNNLRCDEAKVVDIKRSTTTLNSEKLPIVVVTVEGKRYLKEGTKFSNLHGNKGIIKLADTGVAIDPRTGTEREIDVIISAQSINKRKNFGQILEVITNNLYENEEYIIVDDNLRGDIANLKARLMEAGFPEDGSWMCNTQWGEISGIAGVMFWGVTKDPEDAVWDKDTPTLTNNRELRISGLKLSHVELKALITRFGPGNAVLREILSKAQGVEILQDELRILASAKGEVDPRYPIVDAKDVKAVDISNGTFHELINIKGTVVDDEYFPEGFVLRLPLYFQVIVDKDDLDNFTWGLPQEIEAPENKIEYLYNTIFIPNSLLRRCWRHPSGKWGLNSIGLLINRIISLSHELIASKSSVAECNLVRAVGRYFSKIAAEMGTKRGEISTYGMAVRYPSSARATASLSNNLPPNMIEIYREMAEMLQVKTGDAVLVERFPCLGFMSIRPQWVRVTNDPMCKYVIRVSNNSLVSETLDFDGDTLFIASFKTPQAQECLRRELKNSKSICKMHIDQLNSIKAPITGGSSLDSLNIQLFSKPTNDEHAELVRKATGVKSHTGPVIALAYNLMRIVEANIPYTDTETHASLELLLNFLGNTVFKQKHGIKSLQAEATDAICTADVETMVKLGFDEGPSQLLCDLIKKEAAELNIRDLKKYHQLAKKNNWSKVINVIVRKKNRVYFASRANLGPFALLDHLNDKPIDVPSFLLYRILRSKREKIEDKIENLKADRLQIRNTLANPKMKELYEILSDYLDKITCNT